MQNSNDLPPSSPQLRCRSLNISSKALDNVTVTPRSPRTDTREASTEARVTPASRATVVFQPRHHPGAPAQDTVSPATSARGECQAVMSPPANAVALNRSRSSTSMKLAPSGGIPPSRDPSAETAKNGIHAQPATSSLAAAPAVPTPLIAHSTSPAPRVRQRVASPMTHMVEPMGSAVAMQQIQALREEVRTEYQAQSRMLCQIDAVLRRELQTDRKSTRLNSSH